MVIPGALLLTREYLCHGDYQVSSRLAMTEIDGYLCAHGLK